MSTHTPFLLEIGTEEIPARFFNTLMQSLSESATDLFDRNRIEFSDLRCFATPRRLAITATITSQIQKSITSEITGPPVKAAFDENNNPTMAAEGFARSQGMSTTDLRIKHTDRGDYVAVVKEEKGEKVFKVLQHIIPEIIHSLHFPKSMRWGYHSIRFARPIRWMLCLYGSSTVRFEIDGIKSGPYTFGHRLLANRKMKVSDPKDYEKVLRKLSVIVDYEKRKEIIEKSLDTIAKKIVCRVVRDDELLHTITFLVEYPYAVLCHFDSEFLDLPPELLITVMKDHQKYFSLTGKNKNLTNSFIVVSNTSSKNARTVQIGAERVIRARFEDARFYFSEDIKRTLLQRLDDLKGITFHERLGTVYDKVQRIKTIASELCKRINLSLIDRISLSAEICKSDLSTGVVREFPEMQGIIGYYYALHEKFPPEIAVAIKEHYKPVNFGDTIPSTEEGRIISIADKIDSVVAFFSEGIIPSGSEDPYALRRQAQGIVQILFSLPNPVPLKDVINVAADKINLRESGTMTSLNNFLSQRVEFSLMSLGYREDIVESILHDSLTIPLSVLEQKVKAISRFKDSPDYNNFLLAIKRVKNILPEKAPEQINAELFTAEAEISLYNCLTRIKENIKNTILSNDFARALKSAVLLTEPVNKFFDDVLVMDKDEKTKHNRLALLNDIWQTTLNICDFSKLSERHGI